jgi:hypothetical protein
MMSTLRLLALLLAGVAASSAEAEGRPDEVRNYIFGNSLIHHLTENDTTTMPFWMARLSEAGGKTYSVAGQWGFLSDFTRDLPPTDQWQFSGVADAWNKDVRPFEKAGFNTIIVNPANFIQYKGPDHPYDGDNPARLTPVGDTVALFDWLNSRQPGMAYFIYEGWADMHVVAADFPPTAAQLEEYQRFNQAEYHQWYLEYVRMVRAKRPELDIGLIPVGSVMAKVLTETPLKHLAPQSLYSDNSPHGTAAVYFLAAMVTYTAVYGEKVPGGIELPEVLPQAIRENYPVIGKVICEEILAASRC